MPRSHCLVPIASFPLPHSHCLIPLPRSHALRGNAILEAPPHTRLRVFLVLSGRQSLHRMHSQMESGNEKDGIWERE
ncbi:hypothetical protein F8S20_03685 [Nostoc sp. BAE]|nr:hypothetical protein [Nostoc commune BAE]